MVLESGIKWTRQKLQTLEENLVVVIVVVGWRMDDGGRYESQQLLALFDVFIRIEELANKGDVTKQGYLAIRLRF